jgi:hypothetical protein
MDIKNKKPFILTKAFWSLKGKEKKIAEAKHSLAGEQLERRLLELEDIDDKDRQLKMLDIDRRYGKLSELEFNKQSATIKEEPYVGVVNTHFNPKDPKNGFFAEKEEDAVNKWFNDLCKNIMLEDMDHDVLDAMKENIEEQRKDLGDGKVEYS